VVNHYLLFVTFLVEAKPSFRHTRVYRKDGVTQKYWVKNNNNWW